MFCLVERRDSTPSHRWRRSPWTTSPSAGPMRNVAAILLMLAGFAPRVRAQAGLQGHVLAESGRRPIVNAEVEVPDLRLRSVTDSLGRYRLENIPRGPHLIVTRAVGYRPDSSVTAFDGDEALVSDVLLEPRVTELATVPVRAETRPVSRGKMTGYDERKAIGAGHFIERDELTKEENHKLGDVLSSRVPGIAIYHGSETRAWAATGRVRKSAGCTLCVAKPGEETLDPADKAAGAPAGCYLDVYLDGMQVYNSQMRQMPLFNLNSLHAGDIEALEIYTGPSQIPPQYNRTAGMCGVMLIWLRDRR
jgi:hypothetical protein